MANPVPSISCQRPNIVIAMGGRPHVDGHALCRGRRSWGGDGIAHQRVMAKSRGAGAQISKPDGLGRAAVSYSPTLLSRRELHIKNALIAEISITSELKSTQRT